MIKLQNGLRVFIHEQTLHKYKIQEKDGTELSRSSQVDKNDKMHNYLKIVSIKTLFMGDGFPMT